MTTKHDDRSAGGYRREPGPGPRLRTDVIDLYIFTRADHAQAPSPLFGAPRASVSPGMGSEASMPLGPSLFFLQVRRARAPLADTWQPVMGHIDLPGDGACETAVACAAREAREEIGLDVFSPGSLGFFALEQVHPYYIAAIDSVVLSPRFAVEVNPRWSPRLNAEHSAFRWVHQRDVRRAFVWPGQAAAVDEIARHIAPVDSPARDHLRIRHV